MSKFTDYYYKCCEIIAKDDLESKCFELTNEFGYNFCSTKRKIIDEEKFYSKPKIFVNKGVFKRKR